jgi:hypothetical protein
MAPASTITAAYLPWHTFPVARMTIQLTRSVRLSQVRMRLLDIPADASGQSGTSSSSSGDWNDPARRMRALSSALSNTIAYYAQFEGNVKAAIVAGLAPHEKDLADFVQLAKWEDRGYYAMRSSTEKAQRHLHKWVLAWSLCFACLLLGCLSLGLGLCVLSNLPACL